jgi:hypothetical protein
MLSIAYTTYKWTIATFDRIKNNEPLKAAILDRWKVLDERRLLAAMTETERRAHFAEKHRVRMAQALAERKLRDAVGCGATNGRKWDKQICAEIGRHSIG